jgi:hypothetical protein
MSVAAIPSPPTRARVLFDEAHSEAWTIRPDLAAAMQPRHPADSAYTRAASALARFDFAVAPNPDEPLTPSLLRQTDVLVIAHPSDPRWEFTTGHGSPRLSEPELDAVEDFVRSGGGLIVLGETEQEKYGNNLNALLARFGIEIESRTVQDYEHNVSAPSWVLADLPDARAADAGADLLARVRHACFYRSGTLALANGAREIARTSTTAEPAERPLAAIAVHGRGRVAVLADSDLFGDDCIGELDHEALWLNLVHWVAQPAFAAEDPAPSSPALSDPSWAALKRAVGDLRLMQSPDGAIDLAVHPAERARELCEEVIASTAGLVAHFPHQREYIDTLGTDIRAWAEGGFEKPDFIRSVDAFRPERDRADGVEHLVVFPMYKQNASRDTCFEALIVRVPWPEWVAALERSRYENPKFVPVNLLDYTAGYDSECAVIFPETFAAAERPPSHFGAIACDRESERFRRVGGRAAELLGVNLPPDAACLLASADLARDAYVLWDLVHDRTHMHGDLPFDPFMIRQRSPYWMYSLEELRCDLTAFAEAARLEAEGFAFARHVQYAILFDRLFRFPVTGSRVRNYDGLGGQLLFAFLHREGFLHWTDNRLTVDWPRIVDGVGALRERVLDLYHSGIDRSKLAQWIAAHDLVSEYVPAAEGSRWAAARRDLPDVQEPKELVDLVKDDEFPLSLFYVQLQAKLAPVLERPSDAVRSSA